MALSTRTFRIFVSSTFSDLKAERNALQERVFPRLRELCQLHGCRFQAIDLRWGVSEEAALDQQTMKICLGEIDRCQQTSPRPNFIVLLGNRYGWQPLPGEIPVKEYSQITALLPGEEKGLVETWYRCDDNQVPPVYCLQPRLGEFEDYLTWEKTENKLRTAFRSVLERLSLFPDEQLKYTASATEQEIRAGALRIADALDHVFCFFRDIEGLPGDRGAQGFIDLDLNDQVDRQAAESLKDLKSQLRRYLGDNVHEYQAAWVEGGPQLDHLEQLCSDVYAELSKVILAEIALLEAVEPLDAEIEAHRVFGRERARGFVGRAETLLAIQNYLAGTDNHPLAVWGESGSGKSALMAHAAGLPQSAQAVVFRFIGATPESTSLRGLLESLCRQVRRIYPGDETSLPSDLKELEREFASLLARASDQKPLTIFLDALDQLSETDNAHSLTWLPAELPPNVHLVVSALPGDCLSALENKLPESNRIKIEPMTVEEGKILLETWLRDAGRALQSAQSDTILERFQQSGLPLYLKLAFEEARRWRSYEPLPQLSQDIPGILRDLFRRLSKEANHGRLMVAHSLGYLAASKHGLSEDELLDLLSRDQAVIADFHLRSPKSPEVNRLPVVVWSRLYFDLAPYLSERSADGTTLIGFYHRQLGEAVQANYLQGEAAGQRHTALAQYFEGQALRLEARPNLRKLAEQPYQQAQAARWEALVESLSSFDFMLAKLRAVGPYALIEDYSLTAAEAAQKALAPFDRSGLRLIQGALELSAHVLAADPEQLPSHLVGRLSSFRTVVISGLLKQVTAWAEHPWLCPLTPSLAAPGGVIQRTLQPRQSTIEALAFLADGRRVLAAVKNELIELDLHSGAELRTYPGHTAWITALVSPDGRRALSGDSDGKLIIWDLERGQARLTLDGHNNKITALAVTPDFRLAVSASWDATARLWELDTGRELWKIEYNQIHINAVAITPDGKRLATCADRGDPKLWDVQSQKAIHTFDRRLEKKYWAGDVKAMAITQNGGILIAGTSWGTVVAWDLAAMKLINQTNAHAQVSAVCSLPGAGWITAGQNDKVIKVWDSSRKKELAAFTGHDTSIECLAVAPDGQRAASGSDNGIIKVWDLSAEPEINYAGHAKPVNVLALSRSGKWALSGSDDNQVKSWDLENNCAGITFKGHKNWVGAVAVSQDEHWGISSSGQTVKVWRMDTGAEVFSRTGHRDWINQVTIADDDRLVISLSDDENIQTWDITNGNVRSFTGHQDGYTTADCAPFDTLAVLGGGQAVKELQLTERQPPRLLYEHPAAMVQVKLAAGGRLIISKSEGGVVKVWDRERNRLLNTFTDVKLEAVYQTPTGWRGLASAGAQLKLLDLQSGEELLSLEGEHRSTECVTVFPSDPLAASVSSDRTLRVWDLTSGENLATFWDDGGLKKCAVSPLNNKLIAAGKSGAVHILELRGLKPPGGAAEPEVEQPLELALSPLESLIQQGQALLAAGQHGAALDHFDHALKEKPDDLHLVYLQLSAMLKLEMTSAVILGVIAIEKRRPAPSTELGYLYKIKADAYYSRKEFDKAVDNYQRAVLLVKTDRELWYDYGVALFFMKDYPLALKQFEQAQVIEFNAEAEIYIGFTLLKQQKYEQAKTVLSSLLARRDTDPEVRAIEPNIYFSLGYAEKGLGNKPEAVQMFKQFLRLADKKEHKKLIEAAEGEIYWLGK